MAKKVVASYAEQAPVRVRTKCIKMVKSRKTGAYHVQGRND
ncbi:MAG: DUF4295 domain-containing protein [Marinilabiliales bacterium]|nr:DUF4295 domain-containing protein [Marinilabiliales bacterium]